MAKDRQIVYIVEDSFTIEMKTQNPASLVSALLFALPVISVGAPLSSLLPSEQAPSHPIAASLQEALQRGVEDLRLEVDCLTESGLLSLSVRGNGVAIWEGSKQFVLPRHALRAQLEALQEYDFAGMRESYGGKNDPGALEQPPRIACRVMLRIDAVKKEVAQLYRGRQSTELESLAGRLIELSRQAAESGIGADDLADGLAKVTRGTLAPDTLRIVANRRISPSGPDHAGHGWLLEIEDRRATTRLYEQGRGYQSPLSLELGEEEVRRLAHFLKESGFADLPANLYNEHYLDLSAEIMNRDKQVQARKFGRLSPTALGEKQERFDAIVQKLREIHLRLLAEGKPGE